MRLAAARVNPTGLAVWSVASMAIGAVGVFDYLSGSELRVYPLYYGPVGLLAWYSGRVGATWAAILCAFSWLCSNLLAGMYFSSSGLWVANTAVHGVSFLFVGILIAGLRRASVQAHDISRTDPLTSLPNSRAFYEDIVPLLALCRRTERPLTIAYIDLDNFKVVNDRQGHQAGDALLRSVADAIRRSVRPSDLCARLGGDEFAVVLPELGDRDASAVLERMREMVNAVAAGQNISATASIGAVTFLNAPPDIDTLVQSADALMYAAKDAGRNRVILEVVPTGSALVRARRAVAKPAG